MSLLEQKLKMQFPNIVDLGPLLKGEHSQDGGWVFSVTGSIGGAMMITAPWVHVSRFEESDVVLCKEEMLEGKGALKGPCWQQTIDFLSHLISCS